MANNKSNAFENAWLQFVFNNVTIANFGDATGLVGSTVPGDLFIALHTADPGEGGSQTTSETSYGAYVRQAVPRSALGWTVSGNTFTNAALIAFPTCSSGTATITHFSIGTLVSGAGMILYSAVLNAPLSVSSGTTPQFAIGDIDGSEE